MKLEQLITNAQENTGHKENFHVQLIQHKLKRPLGGQTTSCRTGNLNRKRGANVVGNMIRRISRKVAFSIRNVSSMTKNCRSYQSTIKNNQINSNCKGGWRGGVVGVGGGKEVQSIDADTDEGVY